MTSFQQTALLITILLFVVIVGRFRRSTPVLIGGLIVIGVFTLVSLASSAVTLKQLGLGVPDSWLLIIGLAIIWLGIMLAYSPLADRLASRWFAKPPTLEAFRALQQSRAKLIAGIVVAWILGGFLEELIARGIVLSSAEAFFASWLPMPLAAGIAICLAALGAGVMHLYQGPRAVVIITQLSVLFGILFVVSGHNLWTVILCHGLYDTVAFIGFSTKQSKNYDNSK